MPFVYKPEFAVGSLQFCPVKLWLHPYDNLPVDILDVDLSWTRVLRGPVVVAPLRCACNQMDSDKVLESVIQLSPWLTVVVVQTEPIPNSEIFQFLRRRGPWFFDGIVDQRQARDSAIVSRELWAVPLTHEDLVHWVGIQRQPIDSISAELVSYLESLDPADGRRLSRYLHKLRLPTPSAWRRFLGIIPVLREIQVDPWIPFEILARRSGFSEAAALSRAILRSTGLCPSRIRGTLGWKWLAFRWLQHHSSTVSR